MLVQHLGESLKLLTSLIDKLLSNKPENVDNSTLPKTAGPTVTLPPQEPTDFSEVSPENMNLSQASVESTMSEDFPSLN